MVSDFSGITLGDKCTESSVMYCAIQGMQYERWGLANLEYTTSSHQERERLRITRYAGVTPENYAAALDKLLVRFGEEIFGREILHAFDRHWNSMHSPHFFPDSETPTHSDCNPLEEVAMQIAYEAIGMHHPVPRTMRESGYLVNVNILFGEVDFWRYIQRYHSLFNACVDHIINWKTIMYEWGPIKSLGDGTEVVPIPFIKQEWPEAFKVIHEARSDFESDAKSTRLRFGDGQGGYLDIEKMLFKHSDKPDPMPGWIPGVGILFPLEDIFERRSDE